MKGAVLLGDSRVYDAESGYFLSERVRRVAEVIKDYDPYLELVWIPENERRAEDIKPFAVRHNRPGHKPYIVMFCSEAEVSHELIARLWQMSAANRGDLNTYLDRVEQAAEALRLKEEEEARMELHDMAYHVFNSPLNVYRLDEKRVFRA